MSFEIKSAEGFWMRETEVNNGNSVVKIESLKRSWSNKSRTASTEWSVSVLTIPEIIELLIWLKKLLNHEIYLFKYLNNYPAKLHLAEPSLKRSNNSLFDLVLRKLIKFLKFLAYWESRKPFLAFSQTLSKKEVVTKFSDWLLSLSYSWTILNNVDSESG